MHYKTHYRKCDVFADILTLFLSTIDHFYHSYLYCACIAGHELLVTGAVIKFAFGVFAVLTSNLYWCRLIPAV